MKESEDGLEHPIRAALHKVVKDIVGLEEDFELPPGVLSAAKSRIDDIIAEHTYGSLDLMDNFRDHLKENLKNTLKFAFNLHESEPCLITF